VIELGGRAGDRSVTDPEHLDGEVDEHKNRQHNPAVSIYAKSRFSHRRLQSSSGFFVFPVVPFGGIEAGL
jgi:hypothetical protein